MNAAAPAFALTDKQRELRAIAASRAQYILAVGGSRSGKTFGLCYCIDRRAWKAPGSRHLVVRDTAVAGRKSVGMDTYPAVLRAQGLSGVVEWRAADGYFRYPNGSEVWIDGITDDRIDQILGREYATIYANEASEIGYNRIEQLLTRLAQRSPEVDGFRDLPLKFYCDLNPTTTAHWTYRLWFEGLHPLSGERIRNPDLYRALFINPEDNRENLPPAVFDTLATLSAASRQRFLEGRYAADAEHGLWRRSLIRRPLQHPGEMDRIVIGIDPAVSTQAGSDETGIVAVGMQALGGERRGYVLDDASGRYNPEEWARVAISMARTMGADCIVAEANQGGDMVASTIRAACAGGEGVPPRVKLVHATKNKQVRAEPIAGLYERGLIWHVGEFPRLEDQMCSFVVDFDRRRQGVSPDRMDALVWAFTEMFGLLSVRREPVGRRGYDPKPREF